MSNMVVEVPYNIYRNRNVNPGSYYHKCVKEDIISLIDPALSKAGYYFSYEGVYKRLNNAVGMQTPWHHVNHLRTKKCGVDHRVKFDILGFVPPRCLECWKVVVYPTTLRELFLLLEVEKGLGRPSKCGIDLRYYCPCLYAGFFYNNSLEEGRERYEEVRRAVDEHIGKEIRVILKRACTEYEMTLGPSVAWTMTKRQHELNEQIDSLIDITTPGNIGQTPECIAQVHTHWIEWAWKFGDPTVKDYLGGMPLYPSCMTYHEGDISEVKKDMMRAKAKIKHGIDPHVVDDIHVALQEFETTKGISLGKIGATIGYENINPLYTGEGIEITG